MATLISPQHATLKTTDGEMRIAYEERGSGTPIVFLHGIGGNRSNWAAQMDGSLSGFRTVALDLRGYGASSLPKGALALTDFVEDVVSVMDHLHIRSAHLVGLSMGGLVVQALYAAYPERVTSLTLVACRGGHSPVANGEGFAKDRLGPLEGQNSTAELARTLLPKLVGPDVSSETFDMLQKSLLDLHLGSYRKTVAMRVALTAFLDLGLVSAPALVMAGTHDTLAPIAQMTEIAQLIPDATLKVMERCGHFINIEKPADFNHALRSFLTAHPG
ncbi:alpha/beta fold hydrolase [Ottowia thiooxydans]|uniref:3-oxoadipate enol-lactonase n=1 Tax=Ottowia thiooxydans TaxID=219182 RepID=A0ABV2QCW0_9BURK